MACIDIQIHAGLSFKYFFMQLLAFCGAFQLGSSPSSCGGSTSSAPITRGQSSAGSLMPGSDGFHLISVHSQSRESCWGSLVHLFWDQSAYPDSMMCDKEQQHI